MQNLVFMKGFLFIYLLLLLFYLHDIKPEDEVNDIIDEKTQEQAKM